MRWLSAASSLSALPLVISLIAPGHLSAWTALNVAMAPLTAFASLAWHELGHLVGARLMGLDVPRVQLGVGRPLGRVRVGATDFVFAALPFLGLTFVSGPLLTKLRFFISVAAGPLASALLIALLSQVMSRDARVFNEGVAVVEHAAIFNVVSLGFGLAPIEAGGFKTDGWLMMMLPFKNDLLRGANVSTELLDFSDAMQLGDMERAARAVERARAKDASGFEVLSTAATLALITHRFAEAAEAFEALLPGAPNDQHRSLIENNLAWSYFCLRDERHRTRADELSQRAFEANPQQPWAKGTRGAVLLWMGNLEPAERLLEDAYFANSAPSGRAINAACLALVALARSDASAARRWAALAPANLTHLRVEVDQLLARSGTP